MVEISPAANHISRWCISGTACSVEQNGLLIPKIVLWQRFLKMAIDYSFTGIAHAFEKNFSEYVKKTLPPSTGIYFIQLDRVSAPKIKLTWLTLERTLSLDSNILNSRTSSELWPLLYKFVDDFKDEIEAAKGAKHYKRMKK